MENAEKTKDRIARMTCVSLANILKENKVLADGFTASIQSALSECDVPHADEVAKYVFTRVFEVY